MLKRIKNLWNLSKYHPETTIVSDPVNQLGEKVTKVTLVKDEEKVEGVFFGDTTEKEFRDIENERKGFKGIFGLE